MSSCLHVTLCVQEDDDASIYQAVCRWGMLSVGMQSRKRRAKHQENLNGIFTLCKIQMINAAFSPTLSTAQTQVLVSQKKNKQQKQDQSDLMRSYSLLRGLPTEYFRLTSSPNPIMSSGCSCYHFFATDLPRQTLPQGRREFTGRSLSDPLFHTLTTMFFKATSTKATVLCPLSRLESPTFQTNTAEPAQLQPLQRRMQDWG